MNAWRLAWLNVSRRALPSAIAVVAIAWAAAAGGVMLKLHTLSQSRFATLAAEGQSVVGAKSGGMDLLLGSLNLEGDLPAFIPYNLFRSIRSAEKIGFENGTFSHIPPVRAVVPFLRFGSVGPFAAVGTDERFLRRPDHSDSPRLEAGRWFHADAPELVAGAEAARRLRLAPGAAVTLDIANPTGEPNVRRAEFSVTGILAPTGKIWDFALFACLRQGQRQLAEFDLESVSIWQNQVLHYFLIYHESAVFPRLQSLINQRTVAQIVSVPEEIAKLHELTGLGRRFGLGFAALILFMAGACVAAMTIARFDAMSVHMAILRALGYSKAEIAGSLFLEGLLLGGLACLIGGLGDFLFFPRIREWVGLDFHGYAVRLPLLSGAVWLMILAAIACAVAIPVVKLCRQDVDQSLKGM